MSILKAYRAGFTTRNEEEILSDFQSAFEDAADRAEGETTTLDVVALVAFYAEFGAAYLRRAAYTLSEDTGASASMKFMNSIIAEVMHEASLHYYNKEHGHSVVDRAVQLALDNDGVPTTEGIVAIIEEIEATHIPDEEEELE